MARLCFLGFFTFDPSWLSSSVEPVTEGLGATGSAAVDPVSGFWLAEGGVGDLGLERSLPQSSASIGFSVGSSSLGFSLDTEAAGEVSALDVAGLFFLVRPWLA